MGERLITVRVLFQVSVSVCGGKYVSGIVFARSSGLVLEGRWDWSWSVRPIFGET